MSKPHVICRTLDPEELISGLGKYNALKRAPEERGRQHGKPERRHELLEGLRLDFMDEVLLELGFWKECLSKVEVL